jgi:hypothetical protein
VGCLSAGASLSLFCRPNNLPRIMPTTTGTRLAALRLIPPPHQPKGLCLAGIGSEIVTKISASILRAPRPAGAALVGSLIELLMLSSARGAEQPKPASPQPTNAQQQPSSPAQMTNIPYFSQSDGMRSALAMQNNTPSEMKVEIVVFNTEGRSLVVPVILKPGIAQFELADLTQNAEGFDSGNIKVMFQGGPMAITCQVGVFWPEKRISFESRAATMMDFLSSQMNGIVWLPDADAKGFLALTNTAARTVTVNLSLSNHAREFSLGPRETRLLKLNEELETRGQRHAGTAALVKMNHNGAPGDVIGTGFVLNEKNGYSSGFALVDPATSRSSRLAGAGVRFGYVDLADGFPPDTKFRAPLILANVGTKALTARVSADFTQSGTPTNLGIRDVLLPPGELKVLELTEELAK